MGISVDGKLGYGIVFDNDDLDALMTEEQREEEENVICQNWDVIEKKGFEVFHCGNSYGDGGEYGIVIAKSYFRADMYEVKTITIPEINPKWDGLLKKICEELKLPYKKPTWILGAHQG